MKWRTSPIVVADLDMHIFFNTVEWDNIRAAAAEDLPEISRILDWYHRCKGSRAATAISTEAPSRARLVGL
jgi:hypothetical protein